jgi:hypothetical protein
MSSELKHGSGKIIKIDPSMPYLEYEYSWNDKGTGEPKSATCYFLQFVEPARSDLKTTSMKIGDLIHVEYEPKGQDKILHKFGPKEKRNGGGYHASPVKTLTIGGMINLENYENLKIEVSGPFNSLDDAKKLKQEFQDVALLFGGNQISKELIGKYVKRVCGGQ